MDSTKAQIVSAGYLVFRRTPVTRLYEIEQSVESKLPGVGVQAPRMQFLLMKHVDRWDLPKGHVDAGETLEQTALRELQEETGIDHQSIWTDPNFRFEQFYNVVTRKQGTKLKQLIIYLCWLKKDCAIQTTEHLGYRWYDWSPSHQIQEQTIDPLLHQVEEYIASKPTWPFNGQGSPQFI